MRIYNKIILFIVTFIYIYDIKISVFPYYVSYIFSVLGFCFFVRDVQKNILTNQLKTIFQILKILIVICILYLCTYVINQDGDFFFIKEIVLLDFLLIMGGYFIYTLYKRHYKQVDIHVILRYFLYCILFQLILSLVMFFNHSLYIFLNSFLLRSELEAAIVEGTRENRLIGFGVAFFTSGVINSVALILIALYLSLKERLISNRFLILSFVMIFIIGVMMSRTTLVGFVLALLIFITTNKSLFTSKSLLYSLALVLFIYVTQIFLVSSSIIIGEKFKVIFDFGFELIENIIYKGEITTNSTNKMYDMYNIIPDNLKTWIIGDGYFRNQYTPSLGYYKGTDIGFYRIIFNGGILGLLVYLIMQFKLIYTLKRSLGVVAVVTFFIMLLILNLKGVVDYLKFICLFMYLDVSNLNKKFV